MNLYYYYTILYGNNGNIGNNGNSYGNNGNNIGFGLHAMLSHLYSNGGTGGRILDRPGLGQIPRHETFDNSSRRETGFGLTLLAATGCKQIIKSLLQRSLPEREGQKNWMGGGVGFRYF